MSNADRLDLMRLIADLAAKPAPDSPRPPAPADEAIDEEERSTIADLAARIQAALDAQVTPELRALDAFTLASILDAVTPPSDPTLDAWRDALDTQLEQGAAILATLRQTLETEREGLEARNALDVAGARSDDVSGVENALDLKREPRSHAGPLQDRLLTTQRADLYRRLHGYHWIGPSAPGRITAVDPTAQLATVRLLDGSQLTIDGVDYGSGNPAVGADTIAYLPVQAPADPRDPRARPVPAGRAFIIPPPGGKFAYYEWAGKLWKVPWPLTDPDAEPALVRDLIGSVSFGGAHWIHPEQSLGFDGLGRWWVEVNWAEFEGAYLTYHFWLAGWDALGTGDAHEYFYGTQNAITTVQLHPRVWAVDATPGHAGFMGFWYGSGPATPAGTPSVTGMIAFADTPGGEWTYGTPFLLDDRYNLYNPPGPPYFGSVRAQGGHEYRRQLLEHNAYWLWHEDTTRRARWGLQPEPALGESSLRFYDANSGDAELSNAGYQALWWAGPGDEPGRVTLFVVGTTFDAVTRRDPDGSLHPLTLPPRPRYPAGQDRTLTDLLLLDRDGVYWASEDRGDTWYRCPYQLPNRAHDEGGKWVYIIDEAEYGGQS